MLTHLLRNPSWIMVLVTTAYVIISIFMLFFIRKQANTSEKAANAAKESAIAAKLGADAVVKSERAWIFPIAEDPKDPPAPLNDNVPHPMQIYRVIISIANFGKTPATITTMKAGHRVLAKGESLPPIPDYETIGALIESPIMVPPNQPRPLQAWLDINPYDLKGVLIQDSFFWVYGRIEYRDVFGSQRETRFCYIYYSPVGFIAPGISGFRMAGPPEYNKVT